MRRFNRALALLTVATMVIAIAIAGAVWLVGDGFGLAGEVEVRYVQGPPGPPGPAGPQGERGAIGATGAQGATGAAGQDIVVEKEVPVVVEKEVVVEKVVVVEVPVTVSSHFSTRCTGGPAAVDMHWYASNDGVRWTTDGSLLLLTYNAEVWAVTSDGSRLWRLAQAWREAASGGGYPIGWMTSFDVTRDGKQVIFASCAFLPDVPRARLAQLDEYDFDYELAVVGLDGKTPWRLTRHQEFDNYPAWSPDGTRVAFVSDRHMTHDEKRRGEWPPPGLYTMTADGTDIRHLATGLGVALQPPAWSPDGRSIAVAAHRQGEPVAGLYLVPADGTGLVRLAEAVSGGSWSPDGTRLAFADAEDAGVVLYTIAADGSDPRRVTIIYGWQQWAEVAGARKPWVPIIAWSPDGSKLLYSCGAGQFCVVTLDGQRLGEPCQGWADGPACYSRDGRQLTGTSLVGERAVWSPDGARIAVTTPGARERRYGIDFLGPYPIILYSAAPDGSDVAPLVLGGEESVDRVWSLIAAQAADEDLATSRAACAGGFVVPAPEDNPGLVSDCETLLAARSLFGGRLVNWGSGTPLDQWEGVTVAGSPPRVTGLALVGKRLKGTIPPELEQLTSLNKLYLSGQNWLTGCIPVGLKRVPDNDFGRLDLPDCEARS